MKPSTTALTVCDAVRNSSVANPVAIPPLTVTVDRRGVIVVVEVHGELDMLTAPRLRDIVRFVLDTRPSVLVIDLLAVTSLGTSGLAALVEARRRAGDRTRLRLVAPGSAIRLLSLVGMDRYLATTRSMVG
jgi:anti-sigma B factor antagonist